MPAGGLLSLGVGVAGKAILGLIQNHKASQINPVYTPYQPSPFAKSTLATAQQTFNGRMAGASTEEQNVLGNQANQEAAIGRTATDGSQALALDAATQGQTNQGFHNIQTQEAQNKYQLLNNLNLASAGMTAEGDKQYQAELQKYQMDVNNQNALRGAGIQNLAGAASDAGQIPLIMALMKQLNAGKGVPSSGAAIGAAGYGAGAATGGLFGGGSLLSMTGGY